MIWLKIMGGILVVLSGGGLGFVRADKWRSHRKNLEELRKMTLLLRSQILYARGTLEEALEQVGKKSDGPVAQIFEETAEQLRCQDGRSFYEIWQMSVERHWKELLLTTEECRGVEGIWPSPWVYGSGDAGEKYGALLRTAGAVCPVLPGTGAGAAEIIHQSWDHGRSVFNGAVILKGG